MNVSIDNHGIKYVMNESDCPMPLNYLTMIAMPRDYVSNCYFSSVLKMLIIWLLNKKVLTN